jgi:hypothetical protein
MKTDAFRVLPPPEVRFSGPVKVQVSLNPNITPHCLIYPEDRAWQIHVPTSDLSPETVERIGHRPRMFFRAELRESRIDLHEELPEQGW